MNSNYSGRLICPNHILPNLGSGWIVADQQESLLLCRYGTPAYGDASLTLTLYQRVQESDAHPGLATPK